MSIARALMNGGRIILADEPTGALDSASGREVLSLLHKAQVVLVEKDDNCESDAWRLDSVKGVRADDNLYAKYMAGAYGAIPQV